MKKKFINTRPILPKIDLEKVENHKIRSSTQKDFKIRHKKAKSGLNGQINSTFQKQNKITTEKDLRKSVAI